MIGNRRSELWQTGFKNGEGLGRCETACVPRGDLDRYFRSRVKIDDRAGQGEHTLIRINRKSARVDADNGQGHVVAFGIADVDASDRRVIVGFFGDENFTHAHDGCFFKYLQPAIRRAEGAVADRLDRNRSNGAVEIDSELAIWREERNSSGGENTVSPDGSEILQPRFDRESDRSVVARRGRQRDSGVSVGQLRADREIVWLDGVRDRVATTVAVGDAMSRTVPTTQSAAVCPVLSPIRAA